MHSIVNITPDTILQFILIVTLSGFLLWAITRFFPSRCDICTLKTLKGEITKYNGKKFCDDCFKKMQKSPEFIATKDLNLKIFLNNQITLKKQKLLEDKSFENFLKKLDKDK